MKGIQDIQDIEVFFDQRNQIGIKPGLKRMQLLLQALDQPEKRLKAIHLAGTNGKGSTLHMIASGLIANGYRVGIFTSPSFQGIQGHFWVNQRMISEKSLIELMQQLLPVIQELDRQGESPTSFEIMTALALVYFQEQVDVALIETGMGGRLDTTNCIQPLLSIITSISFDHEAFLGRGIEEIAYHKAGIIKAGRPVITGPLPAAARKVVQDEAETKQADRFTLGEQFYIQEDDRELVWTSIWNDQYRYRLRLAGRHQVSNSALAIMALLYLKKFAGYAMDMSLAIQAISQLNLIGRFEKIGVGPEIILDSAHNLAGIQSLIETVKSQEQTAKQDLIFACFADKAYEAMVEELLANDFVVALTTFDHERAAKAEDFSQLLAIHPKLDFQADWQHLLQSYLKKGNKQDSLYIAGSLHFVMLVRNYLLGQ